MASFWVAVPLLLLRAVALWAPVAACFVLASALAAPALESPVARALAGAAVCIGVPALVRWRLAVRLARRGRRPAAFLPLMAVVDAALAAALAFGFADDAGRALRRHGDWFIGERRGAVARGARHVISAAAEALERFDPAPELLAIAPLPTPPPPGDPPRPPPGGVWMHPLPGAARVLPGNESQRFGAARPPPRPAECELGHCGVDLAGARGAPVVAVFDGVIERVERDPVHGGRAGIYLVVAHGGGQVRSRYIHLDAIAAGLAPGQPVRAGQTLGELGASGILHSRPHLHFGLEIGGRYVDPEPYLRRWALS